MSYANGRLLLDADSHIMELPNFLSANADPEIRDRLPEIDYGASSVSREEVEAILADGGRHDREYAAELAALGDELIRGPKEAKALGAFDPEDRTCALDLLGFERQLVFSTLSATVVFDHRLDPDVQYGAARAHNRGMAAFCAEDPRLLGVASVPLRDPEHAERELAQALESGLRAVWVPHTHCGGRSPGHVDFDRFWARLQEAQVPWVLHVGGYPLQLPSEWMNTGRPAPRDWMGGGENVRGKDMTVLHHAPERFISAMVLDGVLERFPKLQGASVELGARWAGPLLERLDDLIEVFGRSEPALRELKRKPSEQLTEQFAFTPFVFEDVGQMLRHSSPELYLFSSDYPHMEGGRDPLGRFETSLQGIGDADQTRFYSGNFERVFGV
ncbi:MAG: amidohydrolase [Proteobacteria bacterium]|nr:amidohydrolase [Pseudomonadota bacterium]